MTWNDTVLDHPQLSPTDKLIFHLLARAGDHSPALRRHIARLLRQTKRNIDKSLSRLAAFGFSPFENSSSQAPHSENYSSQTRTPVLKNTPPPDPRPRTLWSSSSEEDVQEKPQYSPPPGGAGGDSVPSVFLVEMRSVWKAIAPQEREEPRDWFQTLHRDFGPQIPLIVLRQFAQSQRTLAHLRHPPSYQSYFARCCHRAHQEGTPPRFNPTPARPSADDYDQDFAALCRAQNAAQRGIFLPAAERSVA